MVIDNIKNASKYSALSDGIAQAFKLINQLDLSSVLPGKYSINDQNYYMVSEYTVKPEESGIWEAHRQYIDIQYILKGEEKIGYGHIDSFKTVNEYDIDKDVTILSGNGDFFHLNKGFFAIFFPEDVHMPCIVSNIEVQDVRKVIFKVKV